MLRVTKENNPALHEAFETISHDGGGRAGHEWYEVPRDWVVFVETANATLAQLTTAELETFCIGDQEEQKHMISGKMNGPSRLNLTAAHVLLFAFFDSGWERGGRQ